MALMTIKQIILLEYSGRFEDRRQELQSALAYSKAWH